MCRRIVATALGLCSVLAATSTSAFEATVRELGRGFGIAFAISDTGFIAGYLDGRAIRWNPDRTSTVLLTGIALAVNDRGEVAGIATDSNEAFFATLGGTITHVRPPGAWLARFNALANDGRAAGCFWTGDYPGQDDTVKPFSWTASDGIQELTRGGFLHGCATGVNTNGQIAGWVLGPDRFEAVRWEADGTMTRFGGGLAQVHAISAQGDLIGSAHVRLGDRTSSFAAKSTPEGPLSLLAGADEFSFSEARAIGTSGHIAGVAAHLVVGDDRPFAAVWEPSGVVHELPYLPSEVMDYYPRALALGVNGEGQAVGLSAGVDETGAYVRPVVWTFARSAHDLISDLIGAVAGLESSGVLNGGQANALLVKLENALAAADAGDADDAIRRLESFIQEVEAYARAGILDEATASDLVALAREAIAALAG